VVSDTSASSRDKSVYERTTISLLGPTVIEIKTKNSKDGRWTMNRPVVHETMIGKVEKWLQSVPRTIKGVLNTDQVARHEALELPATMEREQPEFVDGKNVNFLSTRNDGRGMVSSVHNLMGFPTLDDLDLFFGQSAFDENGDSTANEDLRKHYAVRT